jgi:hypothetical protein
VEGIVSSRRRRMAPWNWLTSRCRRPITSAASLPPLLAAERQVVSHTCEDTMSNATWVCFDCRQVVRRPTATDEVVRCPECSGRCQCLGRKIPVPPRSKVAAWKELREAVRLTRARYEERRTREAVRERHDIEKKIAEMERRPANASRDRLLRELRERLGGG